MTLARIPGPADIALVSIGTTFGWRHADASLIAMLEQAGCRCELRRVQVGPAARLQRTLALTDLVEAVAARRTASGISARAVIYSSITAALLQPSDRPYAVRFDTVAALNRPGIMGAWQRRREPAVLAGARLLLPWSDLAADTARRLTAGTGLPAPRSITLPVAIEPLTGAPVRDLDAVAYCANPPKRGLDLLCRAWPAAAPPGATLIVGGVDRRRGLAYLNETGTPEPAGVRWAGDLPRDQWLDTVARARVYVNASRYEDWGIGQLEALSAGTPLVTVPSAGPNVALAIARRIAPALVATTIDAESLAPAIARGLQLTGPERGAYAAAAAQELAAYRPEEVRRTVAEEVVPALLASSS